MNSGEIMAAIALIGVACERFFNWKNRQTDSEEKKQKEALEAAKEQARIKAASDLALETARLAATAAKVEQKTNQNASDIVTARLETQQCREDHSNCQAELTKVKADLAAAKALHEAQASRIFSVEQSVVAVAAALPSSTVILPPPC